MWETETFGPCGIGWGFIILSERIEVGEAGKQVHIAHVKFWYKWNGERGEVEHIGGTEFSGKRNNGNPFIDEDAPKKSVTDALVKAMSMIGLAGDIFIGRYDDSKYVDNLKADEKKNQASTPKPSEIDFTIHAKNEDQFYEGFALRLGQMPTVEDINKLCKVHTNSINTMKTANPERASILKDAVARKRSELAQKP
jgi:hypothetical protein